MAIVNSLSEIFLGQVPTGRCSSADPRRGGAAGEHTHRHPQPTTGHYLRVPGHWQERARRRNVQQYSQRKHQR